MGLNIIEFVEFRGMDTVVVRRESLEIGELVEFMDDCFTALGEAIRRGLFRPVGPAFCRFDSPIAHHVSVEAGFPVAHPLDHAKRIGAEKVLPSSLPAGRTAVATYEGSYDDLHGAWEEFLDDLSDRGYITGEPHWEFYDEGPTPDSTSERYKTTLAIPVLDAEQPTST
ncbi:GyrI-like domain-containing protein [Tessaracoccus sp. OH4464_COT-324]|uniref:GyrI-like domain-containing protein n=1 Tax=Tessaracoccus sp. OH4464_COT-324 TaxID=2491059 RepID=UPI000F637618|nr:GyrI-like domain-containing protein [Tessaracoccus sp. OH4464_COT-324]RRD46707.1 AraC family transcriptional regulator [Tessaracoccus sp. OH4464_COT-324]